MQGRRGAKKREEKKDRGCRSSLGYRCVRVRAKRAVKSRALASCITHKTYLDDETGSIRLSPDKNDGALGAPPQAFDLLKFLLQQWRKRRGLFGVGEKKRRARDLKLYVFSCACVMQGRESKKIQRERETHTHTHTHRDDAKLTHAPW